jgi:hypothetical protein
MALEEFRACLQPWYTPSGQPRKPVIVLLDERDPNPTPMPAPTKASAEGKVLMFGHVDQNVDMGEDLL